MKSVVSLYYDTVMRKYLIIRGVALSLFIFCFSSPRAMAEPFQVFLDAAAGIVRQPCEIEILALDAFGQIDHEFSGIKKLSVEVKEINGVQENSYRFSSFEPEFHEGKAVLTLEDRETEDLELTFHIEGIQNPGIITVPFRGKMDSSQKQQGKSENPDHPSSPKGDTQPPKIMSAMMEKADMIILKFDEEIDDDSALKEENYLAVTNMRESKPRSIEYHRDYVNLFFEQNFVREEEGHVEITNIEDIYGNRVKDGLESPVFRGIDCADLCH